MNGPRGLSYKVKEARQRKTNTIYYHVYVESKIYITQMNISMKQKRTHRHREQTCVCQGLEGEMVWEFGISRCKLLHIESINNKAPLYTTGNCIQYPVINCNGKNMKKNTNV